MDTNKIYEEATTELETLKEEKAVLTAKIKDWIKELKIEADPVKIQEAIKELEGSNVELEAKLAKLLTELENTKTVEVPKENKTEKEESEVAVKDEALEQVKNPGEAQHDDFD